MPNYISNALVVTKGNPEEVWAALRGVETLRDGTAVTTPFILERVIPKHERPGQHWSDTAIEAWGTTWIDEAEIQQPNRLIFTSAWGPPLRVIKEIIRRFPNHEFDFGCSDTHTDENFDWTGRNGVMSKGVRSSTVEFDCDDDDLETVSVLATNFAAADLKADADGPDHLIVSVKFAATEGTSDFARLDHRLNGFVSELVTRGFHVWPPHQSITVPNTEPPPGCYQKQEGEFMEDEVGPF